MQVISGLLTIHLHLIKECCSFRPDYVPENKRMVSVTWNGKRVSSPKPGHTNGISYLVLSMAVIPTGSTTWPVFVLS